MMYKVAFEGLHGELINYFAPLEELHAYLLPGWLALWEGNPTGEDVLCLLSPELIEKYRTLVAPEKNPDDG